MNSENNSVWFQLANKVDFFGDFYVFFYIGTTLDPGFQEDSIFFHPVILSWQEKEK